ncbi:hypothetical protein COXBURSA331_A1245 [Coxiella burnetii RSA 331]|nr:hypothetical protein COXBURSA331_A1245 [Coxiella burnetii RSA 331]
MQTRENVIKEIRTAVDPYKNKKFTLTSISQYLIILRDLLPTCLLQFYQILITVFIYMEFK